jgi:ParB family chromosome partitioning protein
MALYRKGEITLDCLMAFTVADSHKQQEKVWKALPDWARERPGAIRNALTEKHIAADSAVAQFVGIEAYEQAGGAVLRDLFDEENEGWLTDPALVNRLASEKLEAAAATVRAEGWKWVEIMPDLSWEALKGFGKAPLIRTEPTAGQQREIEKLTAEGEAITKEHGEEPQDEDAYDRLWRIQERIAELSEGEESWPEAAKALAGAAVGIGHHGNLDIRRGLIRPEDKPAAKMAERAKAGGAGDAGNGKEPANPGLSAKLIEQLTAYRTAGMQAMLAGNPKVALAAVVHALALDCLYTPLSGSCVRVDAKMTYLAGSAEGIDDSPAYKELAAVTKAAAKGLPKAPEKLWAWLLDQDQKTLLAVLAVCAACTVDAVEKKHGYGESGTALDHAGELAQALKLDMARYWQPTVEGYFARVSKTLILDAVRAGVSPGAADKIASLKKDAMAKRAEALLKGKNWLPPILRSA